MGPGPEQDSESVVRGYASAAKREKNLRTTQQEGSYAQYWKPSLLPRASEVMDLRAEVCLFLKTEVSSQLQKPWRPVLFSLHVVNSNCSLSENSVYLYSIF